MKSNVAQSSGTALRGRPKSTAKHEAIIAAAGRLFMEDGYELTSMDAIARKAGVSKLTIYSHFADKNELFGAVIRMRCDSFAGTLSAAVLAGTSPEETLLSFGEHFARMIFSEGSVRLYRVMQAEAERHPELVQMFYETGPKRVKGMFGELLESWHRKKLLRIPDITAAAEQFFSLVKGELRMQMLLGIRGEPSPKEIRRHVQASVAMFLAAYQPSER